MRARRAPGGGAQVWPRVPTARAGGGRPRRGRAGREQRETWLESGSLRGLGVPPQLAGGGPVSRFLAPSLEWRCSRCGADCAPRRRGGWKPEREGDCGTGQDRRVGLAGAGTGPGGAWRRREGRAGAGGAAPSPGSAWGAGAR